MTRTNLRLGDALSELIDHRGKTPKKLGGDWSDDGHRVVSAINIKNSRVDDNDHHYVDDAMFAKWMKTPLRAGDVLLTSEAPTGEVAYLAEDRDWCLGQRLFGLRGKPNVLDGRYLFYLLRGGDVRHQLLARSTGTTVSGIRQAELVKIELNLPSVEEQRRVGGTLGALDDKIDHNQRAIDLLLSLSQLKFSAWRDAAKNVREETFGSFADVFGGATPRTTNPEFWGGGLAWTTPSDVTRLPSPYLFATERTVTEAGIKSCAAVLHPPQTIFMTSRATIGAFAITQLPAATNQGFIAVRPKRDIDRWFLFEEMRARVPEFLDNSNGSTFLEISRGRFKELRLPVPADRDIEQVAAELEPLHAKAAQLARERTTLASLRDCLIPELLSGRVSVPEVSNPAGAKT